jgi:uncharacterized protein YndB with AHSA1/START domain
MGKSIVTAPAGANWFEMVREYEGPIALLWKVFTEPQHMVQFWGGKGATHPRCEMDVRVGGMWHHTMAWPGGNRYSYSNRFLEVEPPTRLVWRDAPLDAGSDDALPPVFMLTIVQLEQLGTRTRVTTRVELPNAKARDETIANGFARTVDESSDRLDEYLRTL